MGEKGKNTMWLCTDPYRASSVLQNGDALDICNLAQSLLSEYEETLSSLLWRPPFISSASFSASVLGAIQCVEKPFTTFSERCW